MNHEEYSNSTAMGGSCKVSMLLNWHTIDACFLSPALRVRSSAGFLAVCLFSFLLVVSLEFLRRLQRTLDRHLRARHASHYQGADGKDLEEFDDRRRLVQGGTTAREVRATLRRGIDVVVFLEQLSRGAVHALQFAISFVVMLLVMYSNGYVIISILLGALVGYASFTRDMLYLDARSVR